MKREIPKHRPESIQEIWPGQFSMFSHFDCAAAVPQVLYMLTTRKPDGRVNACFQSWTAFGGDNDVFYAVIAGLVRSGHSYQNIVREKEFCVNFLSPAYYDACMKTIEVNREDVDELAAAGLTAEAAVCVKAPRVAEAFLTYECKLVSDEAFGESKELRLIVGEVLNAAQEEAVKDRNAICSENGFMYYVQVENQNGGVAGLKDLRDA